MTLSANFYCAKKCRLPCDAFLWRQDIGGRVIFMQKLDLHHKVISTFPPKMGLSSSTPELKTTDSAEIVTLAPIKRNARGRGSKKEPRSQDGSTTSNWSTIHARRPRESSSLPLSIGHLLDGGCGDHLDTEPSTTEAVIQPECIFSYYIALFLIISIAIVCGFLSICFEIIAYLGDMEWNRVLYGESVFQSVVKDDSYFKGKTFFQADAIIPSKVVQGTQVQHHLKRNQGLETAFLSFVCMFLLAALLHLITYMAWTKFRKRLKMMYIGYGVMGVVVILGGILLTMSQLVNIPQGYIQLRIDLEDHMENIVTSAYLNHILEHEEEQEKKNQINCTVPDELQQHLGQLHLLSKMCAYYYVEMNHNDPCRKVPIPSHLIINTSESTQQSYSINDLQELGICQKDGHKSLAIIFAFATGICCFITMCIGSFIDKTISYRKVKRGIRKTLLQSSHITTTASESGPTLSPKGILIHSLQTVPRQASPVLSKNALVSTEKGSGTTAAAGVCFPCHSPWSPTIHKDPVIPTAPSSSSKKDMTTMTSVSQRLSTAIRISHPMHPVHQSIMRLIPQRVIRPTSTDNKNDTTGRLLSFWFRDSR